MEAIRVGQTFQIFHPEQIQSIRAGYISTASLRTELCSYGVHIEAVQGTARRMRILTPFNPELGYHIDSRDLVLATRIAKIETEYNQPPPDTFFHPDAQLALGITVHDVPLDWNGGLLRFSDQSEVRKLLLLLSTPMMQLAASPQIVQVAYGQVTFSSFVPTDTQGDLPSDSTRNYYGLGIEKDFFVFLPNDIQRLAQLTGRFIVNPFKMEE